MRAKQKRLSMKDVENENKTTEAPAIWASCLNGAIFGAVFLPSLTSPTASSKLLETFIGASSMLFVLIPIGLFADIVNLYSNNKNNWPWKGLPYTVKLPLWAVAFEAFLALLLLSVWSLNVLFNITQHSLKLSEPSMLVLLLASSLLGGSIGLCLALAFRQYRRIYSDAKR